MCPVRCELVGSEHCSHRFTGIRAQVLSRLRAAGSAQGQLLCGVWAAGRPPGESHRGMLCRARRPRCCLLRETRLPAGWAPGTHLLCQLRLCSVWAWLQQDDPSSDVVPCASQQAHHVAWAASCGLRQGLDRVRSVIVGVVAATEMLGRACTCGSECPEYSRISCLHHLSPFATSCSSLSFRPLVSQGGLVPEHVVWVEPCLR